MNTSKTPRDLAHHILPSASNLVGICFVILSIIKVSGYAPQTFFDEALVLPITLFFGSVICSYHSLRTKLRPEFYELIADWSFISGLFVLAFISVFFVFETYL